MEMNLNQENQPVPENPRNDDIRDVLGFQISSIPEYWSNVDRPPETEAEFTVRLRREWEAQRGQRENEAVTMFLGQPRSPMAIINSNLAQGIGVTATAIINPVGEIPVGPTLEESAVELERVAREMYRLNHARRLAARDAEQAPQRRDEEVVKQVMAQSGQMNIKREIRKARKPTMVKVENYLCDCCHVLITNPMNGFVIQGNIYVADPTRIGGLVGNNIPDADENGQVRATSIQKTVLCKECFMESLGLNRKESPKYMSGIEMPFATQHQRRATPVNEESNYGVDGGPVATPFAIDRASNARPLTAVAAAMARARTALPQAGPL